MVKPFQRILSWMKAALPMNSGYGNAGGAYGSRRGFFYGLLPGAKINYQQIAGDPWRNSIVATSINWIGRNLPQAPPCVFVEDDKGKKKIVKGHPITKLLMRPNKFYDGRTLRQALFLSLICAGNAYVYIIRDNLGRPSELWYLPHFLVYPTWPTDSTTATFITGYNYIQNGQTVPLDFDDVIQFREGLDPHNTRQGLSDLASAWRELVTDNEASGYAAALLKNLGIPGAIITPAKGANGVISPVDGEELKEEYIAATTSDNRGRPMVLTGPIDVEQIALSPEQLLLNTAQDKPEERICALIGIPVGVLQLGVGLENSTYNNRDQDREAAWYEGIIPRLDLMNSELNTQLLPFMGNVETETIGVDLSNVRALQESNDDLYERLEGAVGGPFLTPNEAREQIGLPSLGTEYDKLYPPKAILPPTGDDKGPIAPAKSVVERYREETRARRQLRKAA